MKISSTNNLLDFHFSSGDHLGAIFSIKYASWSCPQGTVIMLRESNSIVSFHTSCWYLWRWRELQRIVLHTYFTTTFESLHSFKCLTFISTTLQNPCRGPLYLEVLFVHLNLSCLRIKIWFLFGSTIILLEPTPSLQLESSKYDLEKVVSTTISENLVSMKLVFLS